MDRDLRIGKAMPAKPSKPTGATAPSKSLLSKTVAAAGNEVTGLARNLGSGVAREVRGVGQIIGTVGKGAEWVGKELGKVNIRAAGAPNATGVAGGQHMGGNSDVAGMPKVPMALKPQGRSVGGNG